MLKKNLNNLKEDFEDLSLDDRIEYLIDLGKNFKNETSIKVKQNKIYGCVSDVYIYIEKKEKKLLFFGYADSILIKGFLSLIFDIIKDCEIEDLKKNLKNDFEYFFKKNKLLENISPTRNNSIGNIINYISKNLY